MAAHGALRAGDGSYSSSSRHGRGVALGIFSHALPLWEPYEPLNGGIRDGERCTVLRSHSNLEARISRAADGWVRIVSLHRLKGMH